MAPRRRAAVAASNYPPATAPPPDQARALATTRRRAGGARPGDSAIWRHSATKGGSRPRSLRSLGRSPAASRGRDVACQRRVALAARCFTSRHATGSLRLVPGRTKYATPRRVGCPLLPVPVRAPARGRDGTRRARSGATLRAHAPGCSTWLLDATPAPALGRTTGPSTSRYGACPHRPKARSCAPRRWHTGPATRTPARATMTTATRSGTTRARAPARPRTSGTPARHSSAGARTPARRGPGTTPSTALGPGARTAPRAQPSTSGTLWGHHALPSARTSPQPTGHTPWDLTALHPALRAQHPGRARAPCTTTATGNPGHTHAHHASPAVPKTMASTSHQLTGHTRWDLTARSPRTSGTGTVPRPDG